MTMQPEWMPVIYAMRDAGWLVMTWSPETLEGVDKSRLEDLLADMGSDMIDVLKWKGIE